MGKQAKDVINAFAKFNDKLEEKSHKRVKLRGFSDISEYIDSGNLMLNALISGSLRGGYPNTRSIGMGGDPGTGKTFLCLNAIKSLQKIGYGVHYIDTEGALDTKDFKNFGIDLDMLDYKRFGIVSEAKFYINDLIAIIEENPGIKHAVFVDSLTQLETNKEVQDVKDGKNAQDMGLRAKELKALFKSITLDMAHLKVPLFYTAHVYDNNDKYSSDGPKIVSGGKGPQYAASIILMLFRKFIKDNITKEKTGVVIRATTDKNRLAKPHTIEIHLSFTGGMNRYTGLQNFVNWENCKVGRGNKLTEKEFKKLKPVEAKQCHKFEVNGENFYFRDKPTARNFIHGFTGEVIPWREIFTDQVFTDDVIDMLDEKVIKPMFKYSSLEQIKVDDLMDKREMKEDEEF